MAIAEHNPSELYARNRGLLKMSHQQLHDFAATPRTNLPPKVARMSGGGAVPMSRASHMYKSRIHINPAHKGEFTAKAKRAGAGVQSYARRVLDAPKGEYPASTRRQANFAANASKWHH